MKKHLDIRVYGLVQGVFFRASTKETADALHISGFVRNEPDGSVFIEAEGDEKDLTAFTQWCRTGPPRAQVAQCEVRDGAVKDYNGFTIAR